MVTTAMNKDHIIAEIQRTAKTNGGVPLGWRRFEAETGIRYYDWYGQFWTQTCCLSRPWSTRGARGARLPDWKIEANTSGPLRMRPFHPLLTRACEQGNRSA